MHRLKLLIQFFAVATAIVTLSACNEAPVDPVNGTAAKPKASAKSDSGFVLWDAPRAVPAALAFQNDKGQPLSLTDFRGKVVVLNVWATWCGPCREEMPTLDNLQAQLGGPDLEVLTLSIDQAGPKVVDQFFEEIGIKHLRLYIDPTGQALNVLDILGLPTTLLVDRQGRELGRLIGAAKWDSPKMLQFFQEVIEQTRGEKS